jgi:hypothetical protein
LRLHLEVTVALTHDFQRRGQAKGPPPPAVSFVLAGRLLCMSRN